MSERLFPLRHNYIFYCSQVGQIFALRLLFHFLLRCRTVEYESQQYQCHDHPSGQCCCSQTCKFIIVTFQIDSFWYKTEGNQDFQEEEGY